MFLGYKNKAVKVTAAGRSTIYVGTLAMAEAVRCANTADASGTEARKKRGVNPRGKAYNSCRSVM
jgi:hypothetical protein